jgi:hypothetical protein
MKCLSRRAVKRLLFSLLAVVAALAIGFVVIVGPWPAYDDSHYAVSKYFAQTMHRIDEHLARTELTDNPGRLQAGWAERDMTPPVGTPLAGYSWRPNGKRCTAIHDAVFARAVVLNDGHDTVALVGSDLLMTTPNIAQKVWAEVAAQTPLTSDTILFTTSHSHSSPGGFAPGLLPEYSYGKYAPAVEQQIASAISGAVIDAYKAMKPASIAHGCAEGPEFIENRTGMPGKDGTLRFLVIENDSGQRCYAVRYSAHPTVLPGNSLELSAEYPGVLCRRIREKTGATAVFLGGAVGAMKPVPPAGDKPMESMERMGESLADRVLACTDKLTFATNVDIAAVGAPVDMPPMQVRLFSPNWRMSPYLAYVVGLPPEGWIQAVRVGDIIFMGLPYDTGGAVAQEWAGNAAKKGVDLWVSSHCIAYCGYLSPDRYYLNTPSGYDQEYEWRTMNWFGPNQEAMYRDIKDHILNAFVHKVN